MENKDIIELRKDTYGEAKCCKNCKYCKGGWDTYSCYLILDNIHKENNNLMTVHPYSVCTFFKQSEGIIDEHIK